MEEKNCEILFEYLRSILYDSEPEELNIALLDEPFRKLGMGMQYLDKAVREMKSYSADLSTGNLSGPCPGRDNFLCENLKNLHANLNHLTWQAKQVAAGDYSQHVSYLGEFSEAFKTMTEQLREREKLLKREAERLSDQAYTDFLTHIGNRLYFIKQMETLLEEKSPFVFCYFDLDHLKYVNDNYGHAEGDHYIRKFVCLVKNRIRKDDIFARVGGDEFCIVFCESRQDVIREKIERIFQEFVSDDGRDYPSSFSCGIISVDGTEGFTINEILDRADEAMYEQKRMHKKKYEEILINV